MTKKLIGYIRVSTKEQGSSGNGLEAQRTAIEKFAADNGCELVEIVTEVASGKLGLEDRPVLQGAVKRVLRMGDACLVVSKLDRLSREAAFILNLMNTKLEFVVAQFGFKVDPFMLHMYAVLGEKERQMIGQRTREALATLKVKGVKLGGPKLDQVREAGAAANAVKADAFAERMRMTIGPMKKAGMSHSAIARQLNQNGTKTARGGDWAATTVSNMVARMAL